METPTSSSRTRRNHQDSTSTTSMMATSPKRYYYEYMAKRTRPAGATSTLYQGSSVDHVLQLDNLKDFQDASVAAIYAEAQTLEETPPSLGILQEWWRVLQPGGAFFLSAPDMKVLSAVPREGRPRFIGTGRIDRAHVPEDRRRLPSTGMQP